MTDDKRELAAAYLAVALDFVTAAKHVVGLEEPSADLSTILMMIREVGAVLQADG